MEKREKVLLAFMGIAVLGAALYFLVGGKGDSAPAPAGTTAGGTTADGVPVEPSDLETQVQEILDIARNPPLTVTQQQILQRADEQWQRSPFYESRPGDVDEQANATFATHEEQSRFIVTGVLMLGGTENVAIINGWDYRVGDEILPGSPGYYVTEITASSVSIGRPDDRTGEIVTLLTIPLEEDDPFAIRDSRNQ